MDTVKIDPPMPAKCRQCGTPLPASALAGLCWACLLKACAAADTASTRGTLARAVAIAEVVLAFVLVHVAFRALKHFTVIGQWEGAARTNFTPGIVMVAFTVMVLLLCGRNFESYGLGLKRWSYHLNLGLVCSLLIIAIVALGLMLTRFHFDASRPPDPHTVQFSRIIGLAIVGVPAFLAVLVVLRTRGRIIEHIPPWVTVPVIFALLGVPVVVAAHFHRPSMLLTALWCFFGAGFGEEIFYRGYIQSRVDEAFGLPFRLLGFEFGMGLLASSLLFGLVHVLDTVDYFAGHFNFGWGYGVQNFFEGLFYGCVRAKTGSVLPGAIMHGFGDVFARISYLLP